MASVALFVHSTLFEPPILKDSFIIPSSINCHLRHRKLQIYFASHYPPPLVPQVEEPRRVRIAATAAKIHHALRWAAGQGMPNTLKHECPLNVLVGQIRTNLQSWEGPWLPNCRSKKQSWNQTRFWRLLSWVFLDTKIHPADLLGLEVTNLNEAVDKLPSNQPLVHGSCIACEVAGSPPVIGRLHMFSPTRKIINGRIDHT